jgi:hypothetical protein
MDEEGLRMNGGWLWVNPEGLRINRERLKMVP